MPSSLLRPTTLYRLYRLATYAMEPLVWYIVSRKLRRQTIPEHRITEVRGFASVSRPEGTLVWFHCASVGESLSTLTLIEALQQHKPDLNVLITSGTATSANVLAQRMPRNCRHQFTPIDSPRIVARFLEYWKPCAGIFVESELWPNMLTATRAANMKLALINARLSRTSLQRWKRIPQTSQFLLDTFDLIVPQNPDIARALQAIHAPQERIKDSMNLKAVSQRLPINKDDLLSLKTQVTGRPLWVASSTHRGEEETILDAHKILVEWNTNICLILVPRHPHRRNEILSLINPGLGGPLRSRKQALTAPANANLWQTTGEMGIRYALPASDFHRGSLIQPW